MSRPLFAKKSQEDENWISASDLMAGLMMVFLFILIAYAQTADQRLRNTQEIVVEWRNTELAIYKALVNEFESDLESWDAVIDQKTLTIRFKSPDILFETGKAELRPKFKTILDDFMPRYIDLLVSKFGDEIEEVRIEGHTSSEWNQSSDLLEAFTKNMKLSQDRTRAVLDYSINLESLKYLTPWMIKNVSANGLSSARLIVDGVGIEDKERSKRVDFKVKTKAQDTLFTIINKIAPEVERSFK